MGARTALRRLGRDVGTLAQVRVKGETVGSVSRVPFPLSPSVRLFLREFGLILSTFVLSEM